MSVGALRNKWRIYHTARTLERTKSGMDGKDGMRDGRMAMTRTLKRMHVPDAVNLDGANIFPSPDAVRNRRLSRRALVTVALSPCGRIAWARALFNHDRARNKLRHDVAAVGLWAIVRPDRNTAERHLGGGHPRYPVGVRAVLRPAGRRQ